MSPKLTKNQLWYRIQIIGRGMAKKLSHDYWILPNYFFVNKDWSKSLFSKQLCISKNHKFQELQLVQKLKSQLMMSLKEVTTSLFDNKPFQYILKLWICNWVSWHQIYKMTILLYFLQYKINLVNSSKLEICLLKPL